MAAIGKRRIGGVSGKSEISAATGEEQQSVKASPPFRDWKRRTWLKSIYSLYSVCSRNPWSWWTELSWWWRSWRGRSAEGQTLCYSLIPEAENDQSSSYPEQRGLFRPLSTCTSMINTPTLHTAQHSYHQFSPIRVHRGAEKHKPEAWWVTTTPAI